MRIALTLLMALGITLLSHADTPEKTDPAKVLAKLKGCWLQYDARFPTEKQLTSNGGIEWRLFWVDSKGDSPSLGYMIDHENESQGVEGELLLNVDVDPMWLDFKFKDGGREVVWLGIVRFEGDKLFWVRAGQVDAKKWAEAKGKLADRPSAFQDGKKQPLGYRLELAKNQK